MTRSFLQRMGAIEPPRLSTTDVSNELRTAMCNVVDFMFLRTNLAAADRTFIEQIANELDVSVSRFSNTGSVFDYIKPVLNSESGLRFYAVVDTFARHAGKWAQGITPAEYWGIWNSALERHGAQYRFVKSELLPISSDLEIAAVGEALSSRFHSVSTHLASASRLLLTRHDHRNAVKEAVSAVEAALRETTGDPNITMSKGVAAFSKQIEALHPALFGALSQLYGWASDAGGIRHSLVDGKTVEIDFETAKLVVVLCAGFANFLVARAAIKGKSAPA